MLYMGTDMKVKPCLYFMVSFHQPKKTQIENHLWKIHTKITK